MFSYKEVPVGETYVHRTHKGLENDVTYIENYHKYTTNKFEKE